MGCDFWCGIYDDDNDDDDPLGAVEWRWVTTVVVINDDW